jgi:uncharacterized OsmC-like protein
MANIHKLQVETILGDGMQADSRVRHFNVRIDEPKELGGTDTGPNPVEMLLVALGSCQCLTARFISRLKRIDLQEFRVKLEGELDIEGFLKADGSIRPGLQVIRLTAFIRSSASQEEIESLMKEVEKRCPVGDSILRGVPIEMNYEKI